MGEVSIGRALDAGFGLVRRHPGAVAVWGLLYILLGVLPQYGFMALVGPDMLTTMTSAGARPSAELLQRQVALVPLQMSGALLGLVCQTLLLGAAYRAVLFPQERAFFFVRLSLRELWLGLVMLVLLIGFVIAFFLPILPMAIIGGIATAAGGGAVGAIFGIVAVLGGFCVVVWAALRMSLAPPMSFAERNFRLFESWKQTRGQAARLFAVAAVIIVMMIVAEAIVGLLGFLLLGGPARMADFARLARDPAQMLTAMAPVFLGFSVVLTLLSTLFYAIVGGAWAQIYRDLNPRPEEVFS